MSAEEYSRERCIILLCETYARLISSGETRYPRKSDFSEEETAYIKSYLGPWPRALEAAGIKPLREGVTDTVKEKRIRAKRRRTEERKALAYKNKKEKTE